MSVGVEIQRIVSRTSMVYGNYTGKLIDWIFYDECTDGRMTFLLFQVDYKLKFISFCRIESDLLKAYDWTIRLQKSAFIVEWIQNNFKNTCPTRGKWWIGEKEESNKWDVNLETNIKTKTNPYKLFINLWNIYFYDRIFNFDFNIDFT